MRNTPDYDEGELFRVEHVVEVISRDRIDCLLSNNRFVRMVGACKDLWYEDP